MATPAQQLEEQKRRLEKLAERRTRAQVELEARTRELATVKATAQEHFGTDDVVALRQLHQEREAANAAAVLSFKTDLDILEAHLESIETALKAV